MLALIRLPPNASLFIKIGNTSGADEYGLLFGAVAPKAKRTVRFEYNPPLPSLDVVVTKGIWDSKTRGWAEGGVE
jgi:hypothetical protein